MFFLGFLCFITVAAYVQRSAMNGATKYVEADLQVTSKELGLVMGGWYLLYSLFQVPGGWVADRLGSKRALVLFASVWSALTGLAGAAGSAFGWLGLFVTWSLMGASQAAIFPCCTKAIGRIFPKRRQAFASGMLAASMNLGAGLAPLTTGRLIGQMAWQEIFALYAAPGLLWALVFALAVPRRTRRRRRSRRKPTTSGTLCRRPRSARPPGGTCYRMAKCGSSASSNSCAGAMVFFFTWFARYLEEAKHVSPADAGTLAAYPPFAGALGGVCGGLLSEWLLRKTGNPRIARQGMSFVALVCCTTAAGIAYFIDDARLAVVFISIGAFCGIVSGVSAYALAIAYGGKRIATVFGTMNMSGNFGATLFPYAVGLLTAEGNWDRALLLFVAMFGASAVCWIFLNPKGTLFDEESS